jgi:integral membrane protein
LTGLLEGISAVLLFFVAMPAKYGGCPHGAVLVRAIGSIHGALWLAFMGALFHVWTTRNWSVGRAVLAAVCSIVPAGTFWFDRTLRQEQDVDADIQKGAGHVAGTRP